MQDLVLNFVLFVLYWTYKTKTKGGDALSPLLAPLLSLLLALCLQRLTFFTFSLPTVSTSSLPSPCLWSLPFTLPPFP